MAATISFGEDNGIATGSPSRGAVRTLNVPQYQWKSSDTFNTDFRYCAIDAGENSFTLYAFVKFAGSFVSITNVAWKHSAGDLNLGLTIKGLVTSNYVTPTTDTADSFILDLSANPSSAFPVLLSRFGPEGSSPANHLVGPGYTQYLATQLQTQSWTSAGDIPAITFTLQFNEN